MTASVLKRDQNTEKVQTNAYLFILTPTHSMQIFGEIPFVEPQNDTKTTDKRLKTMKNEREKKYLVLVEFQSFVQCLEYCWHDHKVVFLLLIFHRF